MELFDPRLLERITADPEIEGGKPIIKGTRLTVEHICHRIACGATVADLVHAYEGLTSEDIQACLWYPRPIPGSPGKTQPYCFDLGHQGDVDYTLIAQALRRSPEELLERHERWRLFVKEMRESTTGERGV